VIVLDTGSLETAHERSVVALALLGRLRRRPFRSAVSVVIDEAHNVCPPEAATRLDQAVVDLMLWIAGEGRKFGLYLLLSTQRPQKIHRNVLSQCDNLLLMRVNSDADLDELTSVFSHVPPALIREARSHHMGEMLAAGPIAPTPLRLQVGARWTKEGGADLPTDWA
jgi:DNA helicase HerA-like ATPase